MNLFISHAQKDSDLAFQLANHLNEHGVTVLHPDTETAPGENWAKKIGRALQNSEFIVFLLTPGALEAGWLRKDVEYALGSKKYEGRVFSVFVGPTLEAGKNMPWILLKLPHSQIQSAQNLGEVGNEIAALCAASQKSSANA